VYVPRFYALLLIGEEGSKENLVGLDVGDRPLFVQVSSSFFRFSSSPLSTPDPVRNVFLNRLLDPRTNKKSLDALFSLFPVVLVVVCTRIVRSQ
jgi:hypothetical protein